MTEYEQMTQWAARMVWAGIGTVVIGILLVFAGIVWTVALEKRMGF